MRIHSIQKCWLLVAALCFNVAFAEEAPKVPPPSVQVANEHALFERVLALNLVQEPELDQAQMRDAFEKLLATVRNELKPAKTPRERIAALSQVLLKDREVEYLSNLYWRDATLAASLLRKHGNCLSTSMLFLVTADALNLPIHLVLTPRHAFVRWDDGETEINIETTNKGCELSDREYLRFAGQPSPDDIDKLGWCRSLSEDEAIAELHQVAAGHRAGENKIEEAIEHLDKALALAPGRSDLLLSRTNLIANIPGRRDEARKEMQRLAMLGSEAGRNALPPTVVTSALNFLASDAAGAGDHEREHRYLLRAYHEAPKNMEDGVLTRLAFCLRALKDYHGAVRYMELAIAAAPDGAGLDSQLYNLAILQKNSGDVKAALRTIERALKHNPESWALQILKAGYLVADGQRARGIELFETLEDPRAEQEFCDVMHAWFWASCLEREEFYLAFEHALNRATSPQIFEWVDQDPDLDFLREDKKFKTLVRKHRARLMNQN